MAKDSVNEKKNPGKKQRELEAANIKKEAERKEKEKLKLIMASVNQTGKSFDKYKVVPTI